MPIDPNISMSYRGVEVPNPLNQLAQVSQIQASQRQGEVAQMQLEDLKNDRLEMQKLQQDIIAKGGNPDLRSLAATLLKSPKHFMQGVELTQKLAEQDKFETIGRKLYPELFGAAPGAAAAPAAPAAAPTAPMQPGALGSGTFGMMPEPAVAPRAAAPMPTNALAPAQPAAPVANALATTEKTPDELRRDIMLFGQSTAPGAKNFVDMLKSQLTEALKATTVSPGQQVYRGGKVVYERAPTPSEFERLLDASNLTDAEKMGLRRQRALKEATHAPPATATATIAAEKTEHVKRAEYLAKEYDDISRAAKLAAKSLPAIEMNLAILDKGFKTGFGEETKIAGARILGALGVKDAENMATDAQVFKANATQAILQKQLEQKGPQTESDAQRISEIGSQIPKTEDANRVLLAIGQAQLKRDMSQRAFFDKWWRDHKTYDGAEDAWYAGEGGRSLFDSPEIKKQLAKTSIAAPTTSAAPAATPSSIRSQADAILRGGKP